MCSGIDENCILQRGGQVDCWPMDCPPVQCEHPVVSPGDCCPRCEDDPCTLYEGNGSAPGLPCPYAGHYVVSGSEWRIASDNCTSCRCKVSANKTYTHSKHTCTIFMKYQNIKKYNPLSRDTPLTYQAFFNQLFTKRFSWKETQAQILEPLYPYFELYSEIYIVIMAFKTNSFYSFIWSVVELWIINFCILFHDYTA